MTTIVYLAGLGIVLLAFVVVCICFVRLMRYDEGTDEMKELAKIIRDGAFTFMKIEYRAVIVAIGVIGLLITLFVERSSGITFVLGAVASSSVCIFGMATGTFGNVRTANAARVTRNIGKTVQVALLGGSAIGIPVQAVFLLGLILIPLLTGGIDPTVTGTGLLLHLAAPTCITRITTFSLGCSLVAMFNRTGGGLFTKPADISSDLVGKVVFNMPEDDSRMPNTIADFIGDLVNDIAGNCSDLGESFTATVVSTTTIAYLMYNGNKVTFNATIIYPISVAAGGLLACLVGLGFVLLHRASDKPARELNIATYLSAGLSIILAGLSSYTIFGKVQLNECFRFGWVSAFIPVVLGGIVGLSVGKITEYYTSTDYKPVKELVKAALDGVPFEITLGEAMASKSALPSGMIIVVSTLISYYCCGYYGVAVASVGMLSFVAATVSIDAFGPISDNAGGIATSSHLEDFVRRITDMLDAIGNTTAAIGKGLAIGAAALSTLGLIQSYTGSYATDPLHPNLNLADPMTLSGLITGGLITAYFEGMLGQRTIFGAKILQAEGVRQLSIPGILEGLKKPDYKQCVTLNSRTAFKGMIIPSLTLIVVPVSTMIVFGHDFVGGLLCGAVVVSIVRAIFHGNSGGAWDNAKKYVEEGMLQLTPAIIKETVGIAFSDEDILRGVRKPFVRMGEGEYTYEEICDYVLDEVHKVTVACDTTGDTNKDVIGVDLDIFIKAMTTVAVTIAPIVAVSIF